MKTEAHPLLTGKHSDFLKIGVATAGKGDTKLLREILDVKPTWLNRIGSHGRTMVWEAAYRGRTETVEFLLSEGATPNVWGCHFTPLLVDISPYCAAQHKRHQDTADVLKNQSATDDPFTATYLGDLPSVKAEARTNPSIVNQTIDNHDCAYPLSLLHYAVAAKHHDIVEFLVKAGAEVEPHSATLLRYAIWRAQPETLELLINSGAKPSNEVVPRGGVKGREIDAVLRKHGVGLNVDMLEGGWPALVYTCRGDRGGNIERVKELLDSGADINVRNYKGQSALHCASKAGFREVVQLLVERGADINATDKQGLTPLATALRSTIKDKIALREIAETLIHNGADVDLPDAKGKSPRDLIYSRRKHVVWSSLNVPL